jgi:hypothetical protein
VIDVATEASLERLLEEQAATIVDAVITASANQLTKEITVGAHLSCFQARMAWGIQAGPYGKGYPRGKKMAVRPFGGWPARRAYKGRAWRARMKL